MATGITNGIGSAAVTEQQLNEVVRAIRQTPIIDNHAHPLLKPEVLGRHPLLSIITEASGDAIHDAVHTLPYHRAVRQLSALLGCAPTWDAVVASVEQRRHADFAAWVARCLGGLETILVDDGLDNESDVLPYSWHDSFTRSKCRRIVRIEALAAQIIDRHGLAFDASQTPDQIFDRMLDEFDGQIRQALADPVVVAFKSVICYRTGLDVPRAVDIAAARESFSDIITSYAASGQRFRRVQHVGLNDLFVHRTAVHIRDAAPNCRKPIQFHTGLGDNDITLTKSSPAHLQELIRTYPTVPIVLLHSGYPYVRDAGYLAAMYANVYVDIGEVFPFVSEDGQEAIVRQIFELCPWSKVMWSTDGHWFPETYLLAAIQVREVLETVLRDFVRRGHFTWQAAIQLVQAIFFTTANRVYQLGLELTETANGEADGGQGAKPTDRQIWEAFLKDRPTPDFVRIAWTDYTAMPRMRMVPFRRFQRLMQAGQPVDIGITKASLSLLQSDVAIPGSSPAGEYRLHPDFASLKPGPIHGHVTLQGEFREKDGARARLCPRSQLVRAVELSASEGVSYLVGFEIEFVLLQRTDSPLSRYTTIANDGHCWSTSRFFANAALPALLRDIVDELDAAGIEVEQVHAESAPGQFELVLPARPPVEAVDTLLHARETIAALATAAGLNFTLHPKPFAHACGTASHVHMSVSTRDGGDDSCEAFYAGILEHLPAITALTYSNPASYERLVDSAWAGGRWVTWGTQNREAPLRKVEGSHWEMKSFDGLANPYLALAAVFQAGLSGLTDQTPLRWADCTADPAALTAEERAGLGITTMLPGSLGEALAALEQDDKMTALLGGAVVQQYVGVKRAELAFYSGLDEQHLREWILERY